MLRTALLVSVVLTSLMNCKKEDTSRKTPLQDIPKQNKTEVQTQKIYDESQIATVKSFLKWYQDNESNIDGFNSVKGGIVDDSDNPTNYYIDFNEVEKEINFLNKTGFFSQKFLSAYKKRYEEGSKYFKQNPANDGPPVNFDYNYFFLTQEDYQSDLKNIDHIKLIAKPVNAQLCYVECYLKHCGMTLRYTLTKSDRWQIDSIENIS